MHILLVEDERINQLYLKDLLSRTGHTVQVASTGDQALAATVRERFDLVLMDIQLPGMNGIEATRKIRASDNSATPPDVPVLAMTAHSSAEDRRQFERVGVTTTVGKPLGETELLNTLSFFGGSAP